MSLLNWLKRKIYPQTAVTTTVDEATKSEDYAPRLLKEKDILGDKHHRYTMLPEEKRLIPLVGHTVLSIMSQRDAERWANEPHDVNAAILFISKQAKFHFHPKSGVNRFLFLMLEPKKLGQADYQKFLASRIAAFVYDQVVHGQGPTLGDLDQLVLASETEPDTASAIAAAILDHFGLDDSYLWFSGRFAPDLTTYCRVKDELNIEKFVREVQPKERKGGETDTQPQTPTAPTGYGARLRAEADILHRRKQYFTLPALDYWTWPQMVNTTTLTVMSQGDAEWWSYEDHTEKTAIISITNPGEGEAVFSHQPGNGLQAVLRLSFEDADWRSDGAIQPWEAEKIASFVYDQLFTGDLDQLIIHCEMGKSRSAAVAAAIMDFYGLDDSCYWFSGRYYPNLTVYCRVKDALNREKSARGQQQNEPKA